MTATQRDVIAFLFIGALYLALGLCVCSVLYGVVLIVFRQAFGVELPNPFG